MECAISSNNNFRPKNPDFFFFTFQIVLTEISITNIKGGFFSESVIRFFKSPNLQKKYSKILSWTWNLNFPSKNTLLLLAGNLNFKFRIVFWNFFLEVWIFEKRIALSEKKPPLWKIHGLRQKDILIEKKTIEKQTKIVKNRQIRHIVFSERGCYEKFMDFVQVTFLVTDTVVEKVIWWTDGHLQPCVLTWPHFFKSLEQSDAQPTKWRFLPKTNWSIKPVFI